jgi:hyaluronan synthase
MIPKVQLAGRKFTIGLILLSLLGLFTWTAHHTLVLAQHILGHQYRQFSIVFFLVFTWMGYQLWLAWREKPISNLTQKQQDYLDRLRVTVNVPVYNEDPNIVHQTLLSIFNQTRLPNRVQVVDDGTNSVNYHNLRNWWIMCHDYNVEFSWVRQDNAGKRHAQMKTFLAGDADIFITTDSDTILTPTAIEEGLKPFIDKQVASVAGLVVGLNKHQNNLVRLLDLIFVSWQLTSRSALSSLNSVMVNCGPFALYRANNIKKHADGYLAEDFFGRTVNFSDDSLLTLYSMLEGKTVQQTSAIALSMWPDNFNHVVRQQLRWCRGSFIRSMWRFKYLPLSSPAFWFQLIGYVQFTITGIIGVYILLYSPVINKELFWPGAMIGLLLMYVVTLRVFIIKRSDETFLQLLLQWLMSPLIIIWGWLVFRPLRIYAMMTCYKTGWGTRQKVEVRI